MLSVYLPLMLLSALLPPVASLPYLPSDSITTTAAAAPAAAAEDGRSAADANTDRFPWKATSIGTALIAGAGGAFAWWRDRRWAAGAEHATKQLELSANRIVELETREAGFRTQIQQLTEQGARVPELERALGVLEQKRRALEATVEAQQEQVAAAETLAGLRYRSFDLVRGGALPVSLAADEEMMRCLGAKIFGIKADYEAKTITRDFWKESVISCILHLGYQRHVEWELPAAEETLTVAPLHRLTAEYARLRAAASDSSPPSLPFSSALLSGPKSEAAGSSLSQHNQPDEQDTSRAIRTRGSGDIGGDGESSGAASDHSRATSVLSSLERASSVLKSNDNWPQEAARWASATLGGSGSGRRGGKSYISLHMSVPTTSAASASLRPPYLSRRFPF